MLNDPSSFEALVEELGPTRSSLSPMRTITHAACARHRARRTISPRLGSEAILRAILGGATFEASGPGQKNSH
jgi:hypothetical protein